MKLLTEAAPTAVPSTRNPGCGASLRCQSAGPDGEKAKAVGPVRRLPFSSQTALTPGPPASAPG